jgi:PAS domain S-box-containing protein
MQLADFIETRLEAILADWEKFAGTLLPAAHGLDSPALRDLASEMLEQAVRDMRSSQSPLQQRRKSHGELADNSQQLTVSAQGHAAERLSMTFSQEQLVSEFRALRASVVRLWLDQNNAAATCPEIDGLVRFNEAIDQLLTESLSWFDQRTQEARTQWLQQYRALADLSPLAILVNSGEAFVYANTAAARLLGAASAGDVMGRSPTDIVIPEAREVVKERIQTVLSGKPVPMMELLWRRLDGSPIPVEVSAGPVTWEGRQCVQVIAQDISERKRSEEVLREADRRKDEFLATLAHELRNPLAPIQAGVNILEMTSTRPDADRHALEIVSRQVKHLKRLIDDLLDLSRISRGKIALHLSSTDLVRVTHEAIENFADAFRKGGRELTLETTAESLLVNGDPSRLLQVISNLLHNALKFTQEGGHVWVSLTRSDHEARLSVRDDGIGISPEAQKHLFQTFMQVDSVRKGGLGIGLSLAKQLVVLHGGTLEAHSEGLGRGVEMVIRLPLAIKAGPEPTTPAGQADKERIRDRRLLVVDDNADAAEAMAMLLGIMGAQVRVAHDGASALGLIDEFKPDTVFLDIAMPGSDGYAVAREIRGKGYPWPLRLVAVTGFGQASDREKARAAGFDHHLIKPANIEEIAALL